MLVVDGGEGGGRWREGGVERSGTHLQVVTDQTELSRQKAQSNLIHEFKLQRAERNDNSIPCRNDNCPERVIAHDLHLCPARRGGGGGGAGGGGPEAALTARG